VTYIKLVINTRNR